MNTSLLPAEKDPMGAAIADFYHRQKADRLRVFSSQGSRRWTFLNRNLWI